MKKVTFLFLMLSVVLGYSQGPADNAATPSTRDAVDVISIFSDEYANVMGTDFNPNWSQSGFGVANTAFDPGTGNLVLGYPNFNYQGVQFGSVQNISSMEFLHVDIWIDGTFNPNVFVISSGAEIAHGITNAGSGTWTSVDIPVSGITGDLSNAIQFKFDNGNGSSDGIYVDNLYFWKNPTIPGSDATLSDLQIDASTINGFSSGVFNYNYGLSPGITDIPQITAATSTDATATSVTINQATALPGNASVVVVSQNGLITETYTVSFTFEGPPSAATDPIARNPWDVISLYSDAYTDVASTFDAGWCGFSSVEEVMIFGNPTQKYLNNACQGIVLDTAVDASTFNAAAGTNLHVDVYIEAGTDLVSSVFNLKLVNQPGGAAFEINLNAGSSPALVAGSWMSIDIPLDLTTFTGFKEFGITSNLPSKVWYDNLYVYRAPTLSTNEFELENVSVYPNPTNSVWNIQTTNQSISSVQVFDVLGKQVVSMTPNSTNVSIDASGLIKGIYIAKIISNNGIKTIKLIKK
ncbi:Glycosyl hydrolase, family 16 [Winogradskyella psychrotolerans RS-3]|uniref:Glycosyl hydrolase, family 16 n=1 Tax=Winogradskyella psychrotolerans RS-3 TaxID=641526 RepID=S7VMS2_9FLAO|nr:T9SS type A sorting domain-containing protein [Winogradskyella psychrotolerans]EPR71206.1 Glycosyl hydrolase, family 16 [Winogradskyella psychrotolerans RS-3]